MKQQQEKQKTTRET